MKFTKEELIKDAETLKISLTDRETEILFKEISTFYDKHPEGISLDGIEMMRFVNEDVVNVFRTQEVELVKVEDLMKNVHDREGNYIKVPKVID